MSLSQYHNDSSASALLQELAAREHAERADLLFKARMLRAIKRGREHAKPGTYVDLTASPRAMRAKRQDGLSSCGSPAAMCADQGERIEKASY